MRIKTSRQARPLLLRNVPGTVQRIWCELSYMAAALRRRQSFRPKSLHDVDADRTVFPPHAIGLHGFDGKHVEIVHRTSADTEKASARHIFSHDSIEEKAPLKTTSGTRSG